MIKFLSHIFTWWRDYTVVTFLQTRLSGKRVGEDEQGNIYYHNPKNGKRWVVYNGEVEASRVPPEWHAWLHYTVDKPPSEAKPPVKPWEKEHIPNLTGTEAAWHRPGSLRERAERRPATGDYEAWRPES